MAAHVLVVATVTATSDDLMAALTERARRGSVPVDFTLVMPASGPDLDAEQAELLDALRDCIGDELTPHQRQVLVALAIDGVPIDVLAERLSTNRNALYKTLHDARRRLRATLAERGFEVEKSERERR